MSKINKLEKKMLSMVQEDYAYASASPESATKQQFVIDSWKSLSNRTAIFETIPLVYALFDENELTPQMMISVLNRKFDWNIKGRTWLLELLTHIGDDKVAFDTFLNTVVYRIIKPGAPSLKDINGGKKINGFIHGKIKKFYEILDRQALSRKNSKDFTADVVLIWGPLTAYKIVGAENGILQNMKFDESSLITLGDGTTKIACVSLKALKGRLGKITTVLTSRFGENIVEEGVMDDIKSKLNRTGAFVTGAYQKLKGAFGKFTSWVGTVRTTIKKIFSPSNNDVLMYKAKNERMVDDADKLLAVFDEMEKQQTSESVTSITEAYDTKPVQLTTCFREKFIKWFDKLQSDISNMNKAFVELTQKVKTTANSPILRIRFNQIDEKNTEYISEIEKLKKVVQKISNAKVGEIDSDGTKSKWKFFGTGSCYKLYDGDTPLAMSKSSLRTLVMSNANFLAIGIIDRLISAFMNATAKKDAQEATSTMIHFTVQLHAEAVFGKILDVPLIKYDGIQITKLGTRLKFEEQQIKKMITAFKSGTNLPVLGIDIIPTQTGYSSGASYYDIIMYALTDYEPTSNTEILPANFKYDVYTFKCNSGSEFRFAVEGEDVVTGDEVIRLTSGA